MRGYLSCERCEWSRIYARFSVARLPQFCPQCGRRVIRERNPTEKSHAMAHWRRVAAELAPEPPSHSHEPPS
jgi:hypothetical protein